MVVCENLIKKLAKYDRETPWVEFKENKADPQEVAERISGLANSAALHKRQHGYMIWGVRDEDHALVGTSFKPWLAKKGNEDLVNWLRRTLSENADFEFGECSIGDKRFVVLTVSRAGSIPVRCNDVAYIRDGSVTKSLNKVPQLESDLWRELGQVDRELLPARTDLSVDGVRQLIDIGGYVKLMDLPDAGEDRIMEGLCNSRVLIKQDDGLYTITVMGALLFCKSLEDFPDLVRRALRLVRYDGVTSTNIVRDTTEFRGYAIAFEETVRLVDLLLPSREVFVEGIRHLERHYSEAAFRELLANAIMHQDLSVTGKNLAVEIFDDRVEISNPGTMMVDVDRILDTEPVSRNESMAYLMRRMGFCEELGSGWDRVVQSCEELFLPIPTIGQSEFGTRVIMQGYAPFSDMDLDKRIWNCYMHACIMFMGHRQLTNSSLRTRFGLEHTNSNTVLMSRLIKATVDKGLIKPSKSDSAPRSRSYVPYWA